MRLIRPLAAGVWMALVGLQGVAFLVRYQLLPLPEALGRVDVTPAYTAMMALVILGAVLRRLTLQTG